MESSLVVYSLARWDYCGLDRCAPVPPSFSKDTALKYRSTETLPKIAQNFSRNGMGLFELRVRDVSKAIVTGRETGSESHMCHRWEWIIVGAQRRAIDGLVQSYVT